MASDEQRIAAHYTEPGEDIRTAFSAYTGSGLGCRVVGVTNHRIILIKSGYWSITDKGAAVGRPAARSHSRTATRSGERTASTQATPT